MLAYLRIDHLRHKISDCARSVELTGGTGALQFLQDGFVYLPESMALFVVAEIEFIYYVYDLPEKNAVFHIVVGILKGSSDDRLLYRRLRSDIQTL